MIMYLIGAIMYKFDLCPICDSKLRVVTDRLDYYGPLLEEYKTCINPKCKQYHYEYVTGHMVESVCNKDNQEDRVDVFCSYNTPHDDVDLKNMEKKLSEIIDRLKNDYHGWTGNTIVDNFEACDIL